MRRKECECGRKCFEGGAAREAPVCGGWDCGPGRAGRVIEAAASMRRSHPSAPHSPAARRQRRLKGGAEGNPGGCCALRWFLLARAGAPCLREVADRSSMTVPGLCRVRWVRVRGAGCGCLAWFAAETMKVCWIRADD